MTAPTSRRTLCCDAADAWRPQTDPARSLAAASLLALPGVAAAADKPSNKTLYYEGPSGRYLMDGDWLFRLDPSNKGLSSGWNRSASRAGWSTVKVPERLEPRRRLAGLDDRRRRLVPQGLLAARARAGRSRGRCASSRSTTARACGSTASAWAPTAAPTSRSSCASTGLRRRGTNRLVIRVDSKRRSTDFPPSGLATNGTPTGGWWNYSGLQREVYLKRLNVVDWKSVRVTPLLACARCTATVRVRVTLRNVRAERPARARDRQLRLAPHRPRHPRHPRQRA